MLSTSLAGPRPETRASAADRPRACPPALSARKTAATLFALALLCLLAPGAAVNAQGGGEEGPTDRPPLVISEFRLRGPESAQDEFVEIYNNSDAPVTVSATDGSSGFALVASDGAARFVIPNGTVIPGRGHFLGVNRAGYSLSAYPSGNGATRVDVALPVDVVNPEEGEYAVTSTHYYSTSDNTTIQPTTTEATGGRAPRHPPGPPTTSGAPRRRSASSRATGSCTSSRGGPGHTTGTSSSARVPAVTWRRIHSSRPADGPTLTRT